MSGERGTNCHGQPLRAHLLGLSCVHVTLIFVALPAMPSYIATPYIWPPVSASTLRFASLTKTSLQGTGLNTSCPNILHYLAKIIEIAHNKTSRKHSYNRKNTKDSRMPPTHYPLVFVTHQLTKRSPLQPFLCPSFCTTPFKNPSKKSFCSVGVAPPLPLPEAALPLPPREPASVTLPSLDFGCSVIGPGP